MYVRLNISRKVNSFGERNQQDPYTVKWHHCKGEVKSRRNNFPYFVDVSWKGTSVCKKGINCLINKKKTIELSARCHLTSYCACWKRLMSICGHQIKSECNGTVTSMIHFCYRCALSWIVIRWNARHHQLIASSGKCADENDIQHRNTGMYIYDSALVLLWTMWKLWKISRSTFIPWDQS